MIKISKYFINKDPHCVTIIVFFQFFNKEFDSLFVDKKILFENLLITMRKMKNNIIENNRNKNWRSIKLINYIK